MHRGRWGYYDGTHQHDCVVPDSQTKKRLFWIDSRGLAGAHVITCSASAWCFSSPEERILGRIDEHNVVGIWSQSRGDESYWPGEFEEPNRSVEGVD